MYFLYIALPLLIDSSFLIVNVKVGAVNTVKKSHKSITCAVLRYLTKYFLLRCRCDTLFVGRNLIWNTKSALAKNLNALTKGFKIT